MCDPTEADGANTTTERGTGEGARTEVVQKPVSPSGAPERPDGLPSYPPSLRHDSHASDIWYELQVDHDRDDDGCISRCSGVERHCKKWHIVVPPDYEDHWIIAVTPRDVRGGSASIRLHRLLADQFLAFFRVAGLKGVADRILTCGGFYARTIARTCAQINNPDTERHRGGYGGGGDDQVNLGVSNHAYGAAVDINSALNPQRSSSYRGPAYGEEGCVWELVKFCTDFGLYWGGWYGDPMHFEAIKSMTPAELRGVCATYNIDYDDLSNDYADPQEREHTFSLLDGTQ